MKLTYFPIIQGTILQKCAFYYLKSSEMQLGKTKVASKSKIIKQGLLKVYLSIATDSVGYFHYYHLMTIIGYCDYFALVPRQSQYPIPTVFGPLPPLHILSETDLYLLCWTYKQGSRLIPRRPERAPCEINLEPCFYGQQSKYSPNFPNFDNVICPSDIF